MILLEIIPGWVVFIISILSILTAILIGWQVYMAIDMYKVRKDINSKIDSGFKMYTAHVSAITNAIVAKLHYQSFLLLDTIGYRTGQPFKKHDLFENNLKSIAKALEDMNSCSIKDGAPLIYKELMVVIKYLSDQVYELTNITPQTIEKVIRAIMKDSSTQEGINKIEILTQLMDLRDKIKKIGKTLHNGT